MKCQQLYSTVGLVGLLGLGCGEVVRIDDGGSETPGGDSETGDGDGDGDGECPPASELTQEAEFDFDLTILGDPLGDLPFDGTCTITAVGARADATLELDCGASEIQLAITAEPALWFNAYSGSTVELWLHHTGDESSPTWLRIDFPAHQDPHDPESLFIIEAQTLAPPDAYFPAPWGLAIADHCGMFDDGCVTTRRNQLELRREDYFESWPPLTVWPGNHTSQPFPDAQDLLEVWNARADEIIEVAPGCEPTADSILTHRVLIISRKAPVEGDACQPDGSFPCATGLHCCSPCGTNECDFVCTPEDPSTMACPAAP